MTTTTLPATSPMSLPATNDPLAFTPPPSASPSTTDVPAFSPPPDASAMPAVASEGVWQEPTTPPTIAPPPTEEDIPLRPGEQVYTVLKQASAAPQAPAASAPIVVERVAPAQRSPTPSPARQSGAKPRRLHRAQIQAFAAAVEAPRRTVRRQAMEPYERRDVSFISYALIDFVVVLLLRVFSLALLFLIYLGTIAALDRRVDGGILSLLHTLPRFWEGVPRETFITATITQSVLTLLEWQLAPSVADWKQLIFGGILRANMSVIKDVIQKHPTYFAILAVDVVLTTLGWYTVVVPFFYAQYSLFLTSFFPNAGSTIAIILAWPSAISIFTFGAVWPENTLIRKDQ